jgi:dTDP-4-amino-4,6-dideoxygalactose transaminase
VAAVERRLATYASRNDAVLLGHANTALFLALQYLAKTRGAGDVIVTPIVCPSVIQTIIHAGFSPVFVDVTLPLCTIDTMAVTQAITTRTRAILAVHIFGYSAEMADLTALAHRHDLWLIEDAAQSIGGMTGGRRHGNWGTVSLLSFGSSKILAAGGGGALLCDDAEISSFVRAQAASLPPLAYDQSYRLLSLSHRNLVHGLIDALRVQPGLAVAQSFANLLDVYAPLYIHAFPDDSRLADAIAAGLDRLDEMTAARARRAEVYWQGLDSLVPQLRLPNEATPSGAVWRFTMLVEDPDAAIRVTAALRQSKINASNHYWSVAELLQGRRDLPNADHASPRLLNLWVEPAILLDEVKRTIDVLHQELPAAKTTAASSVRGSMRR